MARYLQVPLESATGSVLASELSHSHHHAPNPSQIEFLLENSFLFPLLFPSFFVPVIIPLPASLGMCLTWLHVLENAWKRYWNVFGGNERLAVWQNGVDEVWICVCVNHVLGCVGDKLTIQQIPWTTECSDQIGKRQLFGPIPVSIYSKWNIVYI